ncbi:putative quinol monooxygenase [Gordonia sp. ABKF26]|uniref:putative quinol monooxygenase n=1 Tax=Gordonia sp. ABKF26 TaxID=3238687 RepID=UPI0034E58AFD
MVSSENVIVVARFVPRPGQSEHVEAAVLRAVAATHAQDAGCELYAAHQTVRGKEGIVIIEKWSSGEKLQEHGAGEAFAALNGEVADLLAEPLDVTVLKPLPAGDQTLGAL